MSARRIIAALVATLGFALPSSAGAAPVWVGDFEAGDLEEWTFAANPAHVSVVATPVAKGAKAARVRLTNDAVWPNGLKRVELQHAPAAGRTGEGKTLFFAYSFYLPAALPADPPAQIAYWESNTSYQQTMAFEVKGTDITFSTRKPMNHVAWDAKGVVTAGRWHRIAMKVLWSTSATGGKVDVWYDGAHVVTGETAQTRADDNPLFTQIGLLRGKVEFADAPEIILDDAVEADTLEDVRPDPPPAPDAGAADGGEDGPPPAEPGAKDAGSDPPRSSAKPSDDGGCNASGARIGSEAIGLALLVLARRRQKLRGGS